MASKPSRAAREEPSIQFPSEPIKKHPTIAAQLEVAYKAARPYHSTPLQNLTPSQKQIYAISRFLDTGVWRNWSAPQQREFWKSVELLGVPVPVCVPRHLGKDRRGTELGSLSPEQFLEWQRTEKIIGKLKGESARFRERRQRLRLRGNRVKELETEIDNERSRRKLLGTLVGKNMGRYEADPEWDDVIPIPQDDGEGALAAIAYTEEYAEAMSYLRAVMVSNEYSARILYLTAHIINLNPAHYTVWLYRARTLFALHTPLTTELEWLNDIALSYPKNYQVWHHRQVLVDELYPTLLSSSDPRTETAKLAESERAFMTEIFDEDAKNYHVWSYRQYLVHKLELFDDPDEFLSVERLLHQDVRNNSAWSHRFFLIFSNPALSTLGKGAMDSDEKIPVSIIERELVFARSKACQAPQNPCPWLYIRGVLRKAGRSIVTELEWVGEFVHVPWPGPDATDERVRSSHALELMADVWAESGELDKAAHALCLLANRYDPIRRGYWLWKRELLDLGPRLGVDAHSDTGSGQTHSLTIGK